MGESQRSATAQVGYVAAQVVVGLILGAILWTGFELAIPEVFGHWMVNSVLISPALAGVLALIIWTKAPTLRAFGLSIFLGAVAYGLPFTFLVLAEI